MMNFRCTFEKNQFFLMEVIHNIKNYQPKKPSILTIGTFDGLHIGHQKIIRNLVSKAKKRIYVLWYLPFSHIPEWFYKKTPNSK